MGLCSTRIHRKTLPSRFGWRRFQRGDLTAEDLGITDEAIYGQKLPKPLVEVTTKFEAYDRFVDRQEALEISNITDEEFDSIVEACLKIDAVIERKGWQEWTNTRRWKKGICTWSRKESCVGGYLWNSR